MLLFSVVAHEYAHAEAAYRQGDDTAYMLGRLTLNPLKHIDPFMTVLLPVLLYVSHAGFLFGSAKPVPVNPRKYRNYRRGDIIVSLAGIGANLGLYVASAVLFAAVGFVGSMLPRLTGSFEILQRMLFYGMFLNLVLAFFNLIPVPPLDGSRVLEAWLPARLEPAWRAFLRGGDWVLAAALVAFVWLGAPVLFWPVEQMRLLLAALVP